MFTAERLKHWLVYHFHFLFNRSDAVADSEAGIMVVYDDGESELFVGDDIKELKLQTDGHLFLKERNKWKLKGKVMSLIYKNQPMNVGDK